MTRTSIFRGLAAAFACAAGTHAQAVMLDPRGLGQVLVFPYYTVNTGQDTLLTIINTSDVGKVARVTFREGYNGRETEFFDLYLAAHDTWSGAVSSIDGNAASGARLSSPDHSCAYGITYPAAFSTYWFDATGAPPSRADGGPTTPDRTREGMVEVIALGDIVPGSPTDLAITPVQNGNPDEGMPPSCNFGGRIHAVEDLVAPTAGLAGSSAIVNVAEGTFYSYAADALIGFTSAPLATYVDGPLDPDLSRARSADSQFPFGAIATVFDADGEAIRIDYENGIDAVSAVFMADSLYNDFLIADELGANTDWIVTFPTRQFYVDKRRYPSNVTHPFAEPFSSNEGGRSAVETSTEDLHDHESGPAWPNGRPGCDMTSCALHSAILRYQASVLMFRPPEAPTSGTFGSKLIASPLFVYNRSSGEYWMHASSGWLDLDLAVGDAGAHVLFGGKTADGTSITLVGLPVTGFMAYNIVNAQAAPGRLANYGGTFRHRSHWSCTGELAACK